MQKRLILPALLSLAVLTLHDTPHLAAEKHNGRGPSSRPRRKFKGYQRKGGRRK